MPYVTLIHAGPDDGRDTPGTEPAKIKVTLLGYPNFTYRCVWRKDLTARDNYEDAARAAVLEGARCGWGDERGTMAEVLKAPSTKPGRWYAFTSV